VGEDGLFATIKSWLLPEEEKVNLFFFAGRALLYVLLVWWGVPLIRATVESNAVGEHFLHNVNLPFHEAGHLFFSPFGRFMHVLGGSLGQLLMPLICLGTFLYQQNPFGASVGLWWFAESLMDLGPYIADARAGQLILLGGVTGQDVEDYHDWEVLLSRLGWMQHDVTLGHAAYNTGILLMALAFLWGAALLYRQYKNLAGV